MINFDDGRLEIKSKDVGEELAFMLTCIKAAIPKEDFAAAIVTALCTELPKDHIRKVTPDENLTQILKEMERRRASKNKSNKHTKKG